MGVAEVEDYPRTIASLESRYPQEGDCLDYLFALRWPDGFRCPNCTNGRAWRSSRGLWLCSGYRRQVSVLAGTVFQDTHLPMRTWFRANEFVFRFNRRRSASRGKLFYRLAQQAINAEP